MLGPRGIIDWDLLDHSHVLLVLRIPPSRVPGILRWHYRHSARHGVYILELSLLLAGSLLGHSIYSPDAIFDLSPGDSESIWYAQHYWLSTGVAATALLILMTFTGWWYQQRMRLRFRSLVERIDAVNKDDARENGLHSP